MKLENKIYVKKYFVLSLIVFLCFLVIGNLFFAFQYQSYTKNYNQKINAILVHLQKKYPEIDMNEWMKILNDSSPTNQEPLKEYGIDIMEDAVILENEHAFIQNVVIYNFLFILFFLLLLLFMYGYERKKTREIQEIIHTLEQINRKNYTITISDNNEDELSQLKNELYKTTVMLKESAEQATIAKTKLKDSLSDISHQLKTPLTSLNIMLDNILDNPEMDKKTREVFLQSMKREVRNIHFLAQAILKLSEFDADVVIFENKNVKVEELIVEAMQNVEMLCELKNVEIMYEEQPSFTVYCDKKWQVEALTNILKNCIEHAPEKTKIEVSTKTNTVYSTIKIIDQGEGIPKSDLPHIFERFYKGKNARKDSIGIGLALAKAIIEKNNGLIKVDSTLGKGTIFEIRYYK